MKKLILLLCVLFSVNVFGQVPSYVPANGLVGYWPFNGNANDESGNGNNGTVNSATLTNDRFGSSNSAYDFDGTNDYIEVTNNVNLNVTNYSLSVWVRNDASASFIPSRYILNKGCNANSNSYRIYYQDDGITEEYVTDCWSPNRAYVLGPNSNNSWTHLLSTYDGIELKFFVNNILVGSTNQTGNVISNPYPLLFGAAQFFINCGISTFYYGQLDDIGIWNRALTQQEIANLYNGSLPTTCTGSNLPLGLSNGLMAWYPFCGNANDESGNGHNGTVNGATLTSDRFGNGNSAYDFNGAGFQNITTNYQGIAGTSDRSFSLWFNQSLMNNTSDQWTLFTYGGGTQGSGFGGYIFPSNIPTHDDLVGVDISSSYVTYDPNTSINQWRHLVVTYSSSFGNNVTSCKVYIDNILQTNISTQFNPSTILNTGTGSPNITFGGNPFYLPNQLSGKLDDIGIWNRALTQQEITSLYNAGICYQTVTVTDTLIINANITGFNPIAYQNSIKVYPNPTNDHITIDCGTNYNTLNGYSMRIDNLLGQTVYTTSITQQTYYIDLNTWTGNGVYLVYLINAQGSPIDVKKIVIQ